VTFGNNIFLFKESMYVSLIVSRFNKQELLPVFHDEPATVFSSTVQRFFVVEKHTEVIKK
jgi:hypothetical protein